MCVRGCVQISSSNKKPLQIRQSDHPRDTTVWPVAYLHSTVPPDLRAKCQRARFPLWPKNQLALSGGSPSGPRLVNILSCPWTLKRWSRSCSKATHSANPPSSGNGSEPIIDIEDVSLQGTNTATFWTATKLIKEQTEYNTMPSPHLGAQIGQSRRDSISAFSVRQPSPDTVRPRTTEAPSQQRGSNAQPPTANTRFSSLHSTSLI
jgi:hypothetical protein